MRIRPTLTRCGAVGSLMLALAGLGCKDNLGLPPASFSNVVDTVTLYALRGTPIGEPSGYNIVSGVTARTDRVAEFDFAFDLAPSGEAQVIPAKVLGLILVSNPALQIVTQPFDSLVTAPVDGYSDSTIAVVAVNTVFVGRSRLTSCGFAGSLPRYGKFRVLAIDAQVRTLRLEALVNTNCGYRALVPGVPTS